MGRPDQGNKAQTPVGYSHGTGVYIGDLATAITRIHPRVTPEGKVDKHMSPCRHYRCWPKPVGSSSIGWAACGVAAAWMATWGMQGCYESMVKGEWRRTWADKAKAGIMALTGVGV